MTTTLKSKQLAQVLAAHIVVAAEEDPNLSARQIIKEAGGSAALKKMTPEAALTAWRKAALALVKQYKKEGKRKAYDMGEAEDWVDRNVPAKAKKAVKSSLTARLADVASR